MVQWRPVQWRHILIQVCLCTNPVGGAAALVVLCIIVVLLVLCCRKRKKKESSHKRPEIHELEPVAEPPVVLDDQIGLYEDMGDAGGNFPSERSTAGTTVGATGANNTGGDVIYEGNASVLHHLPACGVEGFGRTLDGWRG